MYAEVAVNSPAPFHQAFSYAIPPQLAVGVGQAVWVPFGSRVLQGVVLELSPLPSVEQTKEIASIIDSAPLLSPAQVELARWVSQRYLSPLFPAVSLMLPPGFERRILTFVEPLPSPSEASQELTELQAEALALIQSRDRIEQRQLEKALGKKKAADAIEQLCRKKLAAKSYELERERVKPKLVAWVRLAVSPDEARQEASRLQAKAPKQAAVLEVLARQTRIPLSDLKRQGYSTTAIKGLIARQLAVLEQVEVRRDPLSHLRFAPSLPLTPTPSQQIALEAIKNSLRAQADGSDSTTRQVFLLHGVTGSGKTEVYLQALAEAISLGKQGIVLVPEIALTPQTIERFASRFPGRVAVLHSKLTLGEQFDEWHRIKAGACDVVIGPRSALFAPLSHLGLIVIDEEHGESYKQSDTPHYHAREVALKLAELSGAVVILGSATPDLFSYHRAQSGDFRLLSLPARITLQGEVTLPQVEVVDMRDELMAGNRSLFSRKLTGAIAEALGSKEQVILFLNRRGTATSVQCRHCGFTLRCQRCDLSLTYHAAEQSLVCHQCNQRSRIPITCPQCGSPQIKFLGVGTQRVEAEVTSLFPQARALRWDRDVTAGRYAHERILARFLSHEADILIGTQMIAKGLHLPLVTLVGVVLADINLNLPDYSAAERTFQLLSQVAGRAGRGGGGRVIVQTYNPQHYAVQAASRHDYQDFYRQEIVYRQRYNSPPFSSLVRLVYSHTNNARCQQEAERVALWLRSEKERRGIPDLDILGPATPLMSRIRGRFRWQVLLRGDSPASLLAEMILPPSRVVDVIPKTMEADEKEIEKLTLPQGWTVDVDPVNLLS